MLAIDPGAHPGYALFDDEDNELAECSNVFSDYYMRESRVVCERPVIYRHSEADPNTIITLAITAGMQVKECIGQRRAVVVQWYEPRQWKGQLPKTTKLKDYVVYKRVVAALNKDENEELARVLADISAKEKFDVVDAVGIGLHDLGRL